MTKRLRKCFDKLIKNYSFEYFVNSNDLPKIAENNMKDSPESDELILIFIISDIIQTILNLVYKKDSKKLSLCKSIAELVVELYESER